MATGDAVDRPEETTVTVSPVDSLGSPFNFDASGYLADRGLGAVYTPITQPQSYAPPPGPGGESQMEFNPLGESVPLGQVERVAGQFMSGQLPQDVQDQIRRSANQQAVQGGFAGSQMARNLTLRDIGLTSLQTMETGTKLGLAATELGTKREISDRERLFEMQQFDTQFAEQQRQFDTATGQFGAQFGEQQRQFQEGTAQFAYSFNEELRKWNDQFALSMRGADDAGAQLVMSALSAQSASRSFRIGQENQLIIANSQAEIKGLQQNLESMTGLFDNINRQYQALINAFTNP